MRELDFTRDIDYKTFVVATFTDGISTWKSDVVICADYDDDDDADYIHCHSFDELEQLDGYVRSYVVGRSRN